MSSHVKIKLKKPIVVHTDKGDQVVEEMTFRTEVVAGDLRGVPMRDPPLADDLLKIAGRLAGQPDVVMNRMSLPDFHEVANLVAGFMEGGQTTGDTPSAS